MLSVELPAVVQLSDALLEKISEATSSARKACIEQEIFLQVSCYLERMVPIFFELRGARDTSPMTREILEALLREVESALTIIQLCHSKSKIYLVTHLKTLMKQLEKSVHDLGRSLGLIPQSSVQGNKDTKAVIDSLARDMQKAHFKVSESDDRIHHILTEDSVILQNDLDMQKDLLLDIARSVGIEDASRNPNALKLQVELLKNDLRETAEAHDLQMMDLLGNLVENWTQSTSESFTSTEDSGQYVREQKRVEPIYESFVCPLTNTVMRDPVTLETGHTYERNAIEKWFNECKEKGRPLVCPTSGKELESAVLKPSIALRQTIEEWRTRNEAARIENAGLLLMSKSSQQDVLHGLKDIQVVIQKNRSSKHSVRNSGLIPLIAGCLRHGERVRFLALATLRTLAEDDDESKEAIGETDVIRSCIKCLSRDIPKEQEEAAALLYELSKFQPLCQKIGSVSGAILVLVGVTSSDTNSAITIEKAEKTLQNLESYDENVREMAVNGRLQPLLKRLVEGGEETRLEMATLLSELVLSKEGKAKAAEVGGKALIELLESGYMAGREAALKCLRQLSELQINGEVLAKAGVLGPLVSNLFVVGANQLPMKLKEVSATILANIVSSGVDLEVMKLDGDSNTLISEPILHNLLHLVCNTGPAIQAKLLQVLVALTSSPLVAEKVVLAIRSSGAMLSLIQFFEAPQKELRANSIKLLYRLCFCMSQEISDGLLSATGQLQTLVKLTDMDGVSEEQAVGSKLLAKLPVEDLRLTRVLLDQGVLPVIVKKLEELRQGVVRIGSARFVNDFKEGLVGVLVRFTYIANNSDELLHLAQDYNLAHVFTSLLSTGGLDEVQKLSAIALGNLSVHSKRLSVVPEVEMEQGCCPCFGGKRPQKPLGLCPVHSGLCSAKETFCLVKAQAVHPLVSCLDHPNTGVTEAALKALLTLLVDANRLEGGIEVLASSDAIKPILAILREHKTELLRQHAVAVLERFLHNDEIARTISTDPNLHTALIEAFKYGNTNTRKKAEEALKLLNKIPVFSGTFHQR